MFVLPHQPVGAPWTTVFFLRVAAVKSRIRPRTLKGRGNADAWSADDLRLLYQIYKQHPHGWAKEAASALGRSEQACRRALRRYWGGA